MLLRCWLGLLLGGVMLGCQAGLTGATQGDAGTALTQTLRYYDGQRWRDVWVNDREVVEFIAPGQQGAARAITSAATLLVEGRGVRIWRLAPQAGGAVTLSRRVAPERSLSPVFHLSPTGGSRLALSGNMVIRFKPEWSEAQIQTWLTTQGLTQLKVFSGLPATYVVRGGNGVDALLRANALQESGEVVYAMPEWWREINKR